MISLTHLDRLIVPLGSAGAKAMAVVRGAADIYLHAGGQHEWDNCAPPRSRSPTASTPHGRTAARCATTIRTRTSPTYSSAAGK